MGKVSCHCWELSVCTILELVCIMTGWSVGGPTDADPAEGPKVAEVLDKLWCDEVAQQADFRAESAPTPKTRAHEWYENLCKSALDVADKVLRKNVSKDSSEGDIAKYAGTVRQETKDDEKQFDKKAVQRHTVPNQSVLSEGL